MALTMNKAAKSAKSTDRTALDWSRLGHWALALVLFAGIGVGALWVVDKLRDPRVLPFKVVRIDGQLRHLDRVQIETAVGGEIRGNFFTVDVERVHRAALGLPWVDKVSVRRVWPQTLVIKITEQVPLARWGAEQLVNPRGDIFSPLQREIPQGLPLLHGPAGSSAELVANYLDLRPRLALLGLQLEHLTMDTRRSWKLGFADGMRLHLGSKELDIRLNRFITIFPRLQQGAEADGKLLDVDLRYSNGLTVRWEQKKRAPDTENDRPAAGAQSGRV